MTHQQSSQASAGKPGFNARSIGSDDNSLRERQRNFASALLDPNMPVPAGLVGPDREPSEKRFNVYRNNVVVGLVETLRAAFPAVRRIVGDEFLRGDGPHLPRARTTEITHHA